MLGKKHISNHDFFGTILKKGCFCLHVCSVAAPGEVVGVACLELAAGAAFAHALKCLLVHNQEELATATPGLRQAREAAVAGGWLEFGRVVARDALALVAIFQALDFLVCTAQCLDGAGLKGVRGRVLVLGWQLAGHAPRRAGIESFPKAARETALRLACRKVVVCGVLERGGGARVAPPFLFRGCFDETLVLLAPGLCFAQRVHLLVKELVCVRFAVFAGIGLPIKVLAARALQLHRTRLLRVAVVLRQWCAVHRHTPGARHVGKGDRRPAECARHSRVRFLVLQGHTAPFRCLSTGMRHIQVVLETEMWPQTP